MKRIATSLLLLAAAAGAALAAPKADPTLTGLLMDSIRKHADRPALSTRTGKKQWSDLSYAEWAARARKVAAWLIEAGVGPGDRVGIISNNNAEWAIADLGVQMAGGVLVPMYPTLTGPQHNYIRNDTAMKALFIMDRVHLDAIGRLPGALDSVKVVGTLEPAAWSPAPSGKLAELGIANAPTEWAAGTTTLAGILAGPEPSAEAGLAIAARIAARKPDDTFTICYTSGTTAAPVQGGDQAMVYPGKGVMLSQRNLASNVLGVKQSVAIKEDDVFLSVLPLAHMFERTAGYYCAAVSGARICYSRNPKTFIEDMGEVKPTVFACVPLLFERLYQGAFGKASHKVLGKVIGKADKAGEWFGEKQDEVKSRIVGKLLHKATGGRVRFAVSGGAALKKELAEFFLQMVGITVLEGYGLTETSPVLTCNRPESFAFGTVGTPIPGVELKLAEDGEILARGPGIMQGYLNLPEETAKAIDPEGWFHTGDKGGFDTVGRLKIVGRKKLLFKLKTGKYISPETLENRMVHELVSQTMVVGENQDYAGALIFPNLAALKTKAEAMGVTGDDAAICADPKVNALYQKLVDAALAGLADFEKIRKFKLVPATLTVEGGELTPTMKLKRGVVVEKFKAEIDGLFGP